MYIYTFGPIDFWRGDWHTMVDFVRLNPKIGSLAINLAMEAGAAAAKCPVRSLAWEGDIRGEDLYAARYSHFNCDDTGEVMMREGVMVGWKQDNNGSSFVAARFPIDRLEQLEQVDSGVGRVHPERLKSA